MGSAVHKSWKEKVEHHLVTKNHIDISEHWGMAKILNLI